MVETCEHCGASNPEDARFCSECSYLLEGDGKTSDGTTLAAITHVLALVTWIVGPLIVLVVSDDPFVKQNAKNALMWQLMLIVYGIISAILILVVIGIFLLILLSILDLVFCVIAAIKASEGKAWTYPLTPSV